MKRLYDLAAVDKKVELGLADKKMTADLFCVIFKPMEGDVALFTTPEPSYFWRGQLGPPLCKFANRKNTAEHAPCYTASQA
jgi:hypothetical protein